LGWLPPLLVELWHFAAIRGDSPRSSELVR